MTVATVIQAPTKFERRVISNTTAVPIGTIMKLEDANTVVVSAASNDPWGGIAWVEHTASEGVTEMTVAMNGRWSMTTTAAAINVGDKVSIGGANTIRASIEADLELGTIIGNARCLNEIGGGGGTAIVEIE